MRRGNFRFCPLSDAERGLLDTYVRTGSKARFSCAAKAKQGFTPSYRW